MLKKNGYHINDDEGIKFLKRDPKKFGDLNYAIVVKYIKYKADESSDDIVAIFYVSFFSTTPYRIRVYNILINPSDKELEEMLIKAENDDRFIIPMKCYPGFDSYYCKKIENDKNQ